MKELMVRMVREEDGQDMIEYALLAAFISIVAWLTVQAVGADVLNMYGDIDVATTAASGAN